MNIKNSEFMFGEYFDNPERKAVKVYKYESEKWKTLYEFKQGKIRHIHSIQKDPYSEKIWICTGDEDKEPMIGWSDHNFDRIDIIGQGTQKWRTCQLVFTEYFVYWGTDTGSKEFGGIYRWDRKTGETVKILTIDGAVFFGTRLKNGLKVFSTDREGFPNEYDDKTRLIIIDNEDKFKIIECGTWAYKQKGFRFNFAKLRLQRNHSSALLAITCLNIKEIPEGDIVIYDQEELRF
jgi:hypothetical protein